MTQVLGQDVPLRSGFSRLFCCIHCWRRWDGGFYPSAEKRPGIAGSAGSRPITQSWRGQRLSAIATLFDYVIGESEQSWRNDEIKRLGGSKVDQQFKLSRLHDGQFVWPRAV